MSKTKECQIRPKYIRVAIVRWFNNLQALTLGRVWQYALCFMVESAFDHPPANETLESSQAQHQQQSVSEFGSQIASVEEVPFKQNPIFLLIINNLNIYYQISFKMHVNVKVLMLILTIVLSSSQFINPISNHFLNDLKLNQDGLHHFVFLNSTLLQLIKHQFSPQQQSIAHFYYYNCTSYQDISECNHRQKSPLFLLLNRALIPYQNLLPIYHHNQIKQWVLSKIRQEPIIINNLRQLELHIKLQNNWVCLSDSSQYSSQKALFRVLSKQLLFMNYCVIADEKLIKYLGLKNGNITMFKSGIGDRKQFEHKNRYDIWKLFVENNFLGMIGRAEWNAHERFRPTSKRMFIIACDFSFKCQQVWKQLNQHYHKLQQEHVHLLVADRHKDASFNLLFHIKLNYQSLPAFLYIQLQNTQSHGAPPPLRKIYYPNAPSFTSQLFNQFIMETLKKLPLYHLSDSNPPSNGFIGKGSEKLVQKLTANTTNKALSHRGENSYVILISALGIGCNECDEFYKQYKKVASFMRGQKVIFGMLDISKNQIPISEVSNLPQVLFYSPLREKQSINPQILNRRHNFDNLLQFITANIQKKHNNQGTYDLSSKQL